MDHRYLWQLSILLLLFLFLSGCGQGETQSSGSKDRLASSIESLSSDSEGQSTEITPQFTANELLIKIKQGSRTLLKSAHHPDASDTGLLELDSDNRHAGATRMDRVIHIAKGHTPSHEVFAWYRITFGTSTNYTSQKDPNGRKVLQTLQLYRRNPHIEAAEPNLVVERNALPNDPYFLSSGSWNQSFADLWGLYKINAPAAWNYTTGSADVVVAVIDTGVDRSHLDLASNMWINKGEIPGNQIDDDGNGFTDDYYGWDFVNSDGDPNDEFGHGTHTAGTIGAVGNNGLGIVGVNWTTRIMAVRFLNASGWGTEENGAKSLVYAADNGARIASNSWGGRGTSKLLEDAVKYAQSKGMIVEASAGNSTTDALDFNPANIDGVITTGATDHTDALAYYSNYGSRIDVVAPGGGDDRTATYAYQPYRSILSLKSSVINSLMTGNGALIIGGNYVRQTGTSMSGPHVSGLAALILSHNPSLSPEEVRQIIRLSAADIGALGRDAKFGFGRIDAAKALALSDTHILTPFITSPSTRSLIMGTSLEVTGGILGPNFSSYRVEIGAGRNPTSWIFIKSSTEQILNGTLAMIDNRILADGTYTLRLTATDTQGTRTFAEVFDLKVDNFDVRLSSPRFFAAKGVIDITGTAQVLNGVPFDRFTVEVTTATGAWSTNGVALINNGMFQITDGKLATLDTTTRSGIFGVRLTVYSALGTNQSTKNSGIKIDDRLVPGWPKIYPVPWYLQVSGPDLSPGALFADIDGDNVPEIVTSANGNQLFAHRKNGTLVPGFPVTLSAGHKAEYQRIRGQPNVSDLDGDGRKEVMVGLQYRDETGIFRGQVQIVRGDGTLFLPWTPPPPTTSMGILYDFTPVIGDLDGDTKPDLVVMLNDLTKLGGYHADGTAVAGFPVSGAPERFQSGRFLTADMNRDGRSDVIASSVYSYISPVSRVAYTLFGFSGLGTVLPGWPLPAVPRICGRPAVGDFFGDGINRVFHIASVAKQYANGLWYSEGYLYGWNVDGTMLANFPRSVGVMDGCAWPTVADMNNDGKDDILVMINEAVAIVSTAGDRKIALPGSLVRSPVSIADFDGDGSMDMLFVDRYSIIFNSRIAIAKQDGSIYWSTINQASYFQDGISLYPHVFTADTDRNGAMEVLAFASAYPIGIDPKAPFPDNVTITETWEFLWEIPPSTGKLAYPASGWPMHMANASRTGKREGAANPPPPPPPPPVDTVPPSAVIEVPSTGETFSGVITINVSASDNVAVTKVELYVDEILKGTDTSAPYSYNVDSHTLTNASHSLQAKAYDAAGNFGTSSSITIIVDNAPNDTTPPTVTLSCPSAGCTVQGGSTAMLTADASDNVGVARVEFFRVSKNGALGSTPICTSTSVPYSCNWKVPGSGGKQYTFRAKAFDGAGNSSFSNAVILNSAR